MKKLLLSLATVLCCGLASVAETSYTIEFVNGANNSGGDLKSTTYATALEETSKQYISGVVGEPTLTSVGKYGLKIGQNKKGGSIEFSLADNAKVLPIKVEVKTSVNKNASYQKFEFNDLAGGTYASTNEMAETDNTGDYATFTFSNFTAPLASIKLEKTNASETKSQQGFIFVKSITVYYEGGSITPTCNKPVFTPASGSSLYAEDTVTLDCTTDGAEIFYKVGEGEFAKYENPILFTENGTYTVTAYAKAEGMNDSAAVEATYTYDKVRPAFIEDVLTYNVFKDANGKAPAGGNTNYGDYTFTSELTGIVYAANMATDKNSIQLRSKDNSGIITTENKDGYVLAGVVIEWNEGTADRTLDIYGKESAYSATSDLYGNNKGTKIGSIERTGTSFTVDNPKDVFAGLRSNNGAMYINKITLRWLKPAEKKDFVFDVDYVDRFAEGAEGITFAVKVPEDMTETAGKFTWSCDDTANVALGVADEKTEVYIVESGVYTINLAFAGDDVYKANKTYFLVRVYPDVNDHMNMADNEGIAVETGDPNKTSFQYFIPNYNADYNYYYLLTPTSVSGGEEDGPVLGAPATHTAYDHGTGITLEGNGTLSMIIEKNGVESPAKSFSYSITTGINSIEADAQDARFFTIDGVEVSGNEPGLYIRVANGKAEKVIR